MEKRKFTRLISTLIVILSYGCIAGANTIPICTESGIQTLPASVKSHYNLKEDGIIICWFDERDNGSLYVQKIDVYGNTVWMKNGILVDSDLGTWFSPESDYPQIFSNDLGGAIIVYTKPNTGEIYVQKITRDGTLLRTPLLLTGHYGGHNFSPRAVSSKNDITIAWENFSEGNFNIQAQRIDFNCTKLWNNGAEVSVCDNLYDQRKPTLEVDENDGAYFTWLDARPTEYHGDFVLDLYGNMLNSNGEYTQFGSQGKLVFSHANKYDLKSDIPENYSSYIRKHELNYLRKEYLYNHNLVPSDNNSIIVAVEEQIDNYDSFIRVIKINEHLDQVWNKIIDAASFQSKPITVSNHNNGLFILWNDARNYGDDIYGIMIDESGNIQWGSENGTQISQEQTKLFTRTLASDKIINPIHIHKKNIFASWVIPETNKLFLSNIDLETKRDNFMKPLIIQEGMYEGQFTSVIKLLENIVVLYKHSNDVLASITPIKPPIPASENKLSIRNFPNPFNPLTNININLPNEGIVRLAVYDIAGREVKKLLNEYRPSGSHNIKFDGSSLSSGIYFCRIQTNDLEEILKMTLLK